MQIRKSDVEAALFTDEHGVVVGLDEVQLLEHPPEGRIAVLHEALGMDDLELRYRASIVLAAWGDDKGLNAIEDLIDIRIDELGVNIPHRILSYNNIFDELAYAVYLYGDVGQRTADQVRIYKKLLSIYGPCDFESKLKTALLCSEYKELFGDVENACRRSIDLGKKYLASQLLPVIARWDQATAWKLIPLFLEEAVVTPNPTANVVEALKYVEPSLGTPLLHQLVSHADSVVANEAKQLIAEKQT